MLLANSGKFANTPQIQEFSERFALRGQIGDLGKVLGAISKFGGTFVGHAMIFLDVYAFSQSIKGEKVRFS